MADEELKTAKQWLKEGFVPRPNAEGEEKYWYARQMYVTFYSRKEVTREKRAVQRVVKRLRKKKNAQAKLYREHKKICKQIMDHDYFIVWVQFPTDEERFESWFKSLDEDARDSFDMWYDGPRSYAYCVKTEEEFNKIELDQEIEIVTADGPQTVEVVGKRVGKLEFTEHSYPNIPKLLYPYKYTDGTLVELPKIEK